MSIYKKLHEIQCHVKGLKKDKKSYGFDYLTGTKLLSFIRPLMDSKGLLLKQEVLSIDNERIDYQVKSGNKSEMFSKVMMRFTWIDSDTNEKDENLFGANGQNDWEKGLGSALTYAERYFLLKYFHISTDEDDIDNPERKEGVKELEPIKVEIEKVSRVFTLNIATDEVMKKTSLIELKKRFDLTPEQEKKYSELLNK